MVDSVVLPPDANGTPGVTGALAPGQTMPANEPTDAELNPTLPGVTKAPEGTPAKFLNEDGSLNAAAMLASYSEMERKQSSAGDKPPAGDTPKPADLRMPETQVSYGKVVDDAIASAGLTPASVNQEYMDNGKLSAATMDKLAQAGFSKEVVQQYVKGFEDAARADGAEAQIAETKITEIMQIAGGKEGYSQMAQWAATHLSKPELDAFDSAMDTGDVSTIEMAVRGLHSKYVQAEGQDPSLLLGGLRPSQDVFQSPQEASDALHAAQKSGDPAKIKAAEAKALRSNVF